jgi:hypothetical protein
LGALSSPGDDPGYQFQISYQLPRSNVRVGTTPRGGVSWPARNTTGVPGAFEDDFIVPAAASAYLNAIDQLQQYRR